MWNSLQSGARCLPPHHTRRNVLPCQGSVRLFLQPCWWEVAVLSYLCFLLGFWGINKTKQANKGRKEFLFANNFPSVSHSVWLRGTFLHCIHLILTNTKSGRRLWASYFPSGSLAVNGSHPRHWGWLLVQKSSLQSKNDPKITKFCLTRGFWIILYHHKEGEVLFKAQSKSLSLLILLGS